jgi:hypothetical protein
MKKIINTIKEILIVTLQITQYIFISLEYISRQSNKILDKIILILQENKCNSGEDEQVEVNKHGFPFYFGKK